MVCRLSDVKPLPERILGYWQLESEELQWNSQQNKKIINENVFKNIVCEMAAILFRGDELNS